MGCPFHKEDKKSFFTKVKNLFGFGLKKQEGYGSIVGMEAANLRAILDTTVDSIITIDEDGIVLAFNKTAEKMFGYSKEEIVGKNVKMLMPEPYHSEHDTYLLNYRETGKKKIIGIGREVMAKRKDHTTFPIDLAVSEVIVDSKRLFTGIIRNISIKKEMEQTRLENLRIETEMKAKNEFITMISHELRTPLHSIMGYIECLMNEIDGPINEAQKDSLQRSYNASQHLLQLVNGILELSKIASLQVETNLEKCDVVEILNFCLETISPLANKKNIPLIKNVPETPVYLMAQFNHIQQILLNLLSNAIKFTDKGKIICSIKENRESIEVIIQDTGIGIEPNSIAKVFIPFVRLSENGSKKVIRSGLGLGLAITKQLIELYKGKIEVTSEKGIGSTFTVIFPKKQTNLSL